MELSDILREAKEREARDPHRLAGWRVNAEGDLHEWSEVGFLQCDPRTFVGMSAVCACGWATKATTDGRAKAAWRSHRTRATTSAHHHSERARSIEVMYPIDRKKATEGFCE